MGAPLKLPPRRVDETAALNGGADSTAARVDDDEVFLGAKNARAGLRVATCCAFLLVLFAGVAGMTSASTRPTAAASLGARVAAGLGGVGADGGRHRGVGQRSQLPPQIATNHNTTAPRLGPAFTLRERGHWGAARASEYEVDAVNAHATPGNGESRGEFSALGTEEVVQRDQQRQQQQQQRQQQKGQRQQQQPQGAVPRVGGGDESGASCEIPGEARGFCAKYTADERRCAHTGNWLVDSCLRITELPRYFKRVDDDLAAAAAAADNDRGEEEGEKAGGRDGVTRRQSGQSEDDHGIRSAARPLDKPQWRLRQRPLPLSPASLKAARDNRAWLPYPQWLVRYYACVNGQVDDDERPYRIPPAGCSKPSFDAHEEQAAPAAATGAGPGGGPESVALQPPPANTAFVYAFVHVPKAAGSYFTEILRAQLWRLKEKNKRSDPRHTYYSNEWYEPVMDLTEPNFREVVQRYMNGSPAPQTSAAGMAESYRAGYREIFKGSLAMGFCDIVRAPCAYLTVLRNPVERLLSQYAYLCLEGSEDRGGWTEEWKLTGKCPLDPVAYFEKMGGVEVGVQLMAPRGSPGSRCSLEAAKDNLVHGCTRYLLVEKLADGVQKLGAHLPDFAGFGDVPESFSAISDPTMLYTHNGSKERLSPAQAKRMEDYRADPGVMSRLRELAAHEIELYDYAVDNYEAQWDKPLMTC